jgi:diguanylate cyclase (GGDEF)-like protein
MVFASRIGKIYPYLHLLLLGACLLWYHFGQVAPNYDNIILYSLLGYAVIILSCGWIGLRKFIDFDILLFIHGIFDAIIIAIMVKFTGGFASDFYLAFFPAVALASVVSASWRSYIGAFWFGLCFWLASYPQSLDPAYVYVVGFRLLSIWSVGAVAFSVSHSMRSYEVKLLKTLDILNERTWELERSQSQLSIIYETTRALSGILNLENLLNEILEVAERIFHFQKCQVFLSNVAEDCIYLHASLANGNRRIFEKPSLYVQDISSSAHNDEMNTTPYHREHGTNANSIDIPLISRGKIMGILRIITEKGTPPSERERHLLSILSNSAAVAIDNSLLHKKTEELTITDGLTELFNYRYFRNKLSDEVRRADRYRQRFSLLMLDLDHFKNVNDQYGHQTGNIVLREVSGIIKQCLRDVDIVARYGGEEFVVILPQTGDNDALMIAERIRSSIEMAYFSNVQGQRDIQITISIGIASYPNGVHTAEQLLDKVDKALYDAKGDGRNKVHMSDMDKQKSITAVL